MTLEPVLGSAEDIATGLGGWRSDEGAFKRDDLKILQYRAEDDTLISEESCAAVRQFSHEMCEEANQGAFGMLLGVSKSGDKPIDHYLEVPNRPTIERSQIIDPVADKLAIAIGASVRGFDECLWTITPCVENAALLKIVEGLTDLFSGATAERLRAVCDAGPLQECYRHKVTCFIDRNDLLGDEKECKKLRELCDRHGIDKFWIGHEGVELL